MLGPGQASPRLLARTGIWAIGWAGLGAHLVPLSLGVTSVTACVAVSSVLRPPSWAADALGCPGFGKPLRAACVIGEMVAVALGALRCAHMVGREVGYCTLEAYFYVRRGADVGPMPRHQTFSANLSDGPVGRQRWSMLWYWTYKGSCVPQK